MTASPGDGEHAAREGYYPDPSIPGYVRYWSGASWVPGTSRPAAPADETGPVFLDETSVTETLPEPARAPDPEPDPEPEPEAVGWQADPLHQAGFGGSRDARVSWGGPAEPESRPAGISLARGAVPAGAVTAGATARRLPAQAPAESVGILSARSPATPALPALPSAPAAPSASSAPAAPALPSAPAWPDAPGGSGSGLTSSWPEAAPAPSAAATAPAAPRRDADRRAEVLLGAAEVRSARPLPTAPPLPEPTVWPPAPAPAEPGPQASRHPEAARTAVAPPAPPLPDPGPGTGAKAPAAAERPAKSTPRAVFERMAERAVRPAGLVRRLLARAVDSLVLAGVAAAVALPLVPLVRAHLQAKVDAARIGGRTTTVWLLDATTTGYLGLVLAAVLLFGILYEVLPTARWGRTPGKKLFGLRVLSTATLRPPRFGAALRRWLVYAFLGLPGSLWCLVDRPRRQAWHDKAARTYVAR
ncbi:RDD family protein [Streptomyces sp. NPDC003042]